MYVYAGRCRDCGCEHRLARTPEAEAAARRLLSEMGEAPSGGKMLGVLLVEGGAALRAFSGQLDGLWDVPGFVPPVATPDLAAEAATLAVIRALEVELEHAERTLAAARSAHANAEAEWARRAGALSRGHAEARRRRRTLRAAGGPGDVLDEASRADTRERRAVRREGAVVVIPLTEALAHAQAAVDDVRRRRAEASRALMRHMHDGYVLTGVGGRERPMRDVFGGDMPSGTGDCCAPKLLHFAGRAGLWPVGLAEIWWGEGRDHGALQPACAERCAPLLGHLLCPAR